MSDFENTIDDLHLNDDAVTASIIDRTITEFKDDKIIMLGKNAFRFCQELTTVELPNCTSLGGASYPSFTFADCHKLRYVSLPEVMSIPQDCFQRVGASSNGDLELYLPKARTFGDRSFNLAKVKLIDTSNLSTIRQSCFTSATIQHLVLRWDGICALNANSGIENVENVYVHKDYLDAYQNDTNWSAFEGNWWTVEDLPSPEEL